MAALAAALMGGLQLFQTQSAYDAKRQQADAAISYGGFQRAAYDQNANYADAQAADAIQRGATLEGQSRAATRQAVGAARAAAGAGGVSATTGSALQMETDTARIGALDALTIRANAQRESLGYTAQAASFRTQGNLAYTAGENEAAGLRAQAKSGLFTGIAQGVNMFAKDISDAGGLRAAGRALKTRQGWIGF